MYEESVYKIVKIFCKKKVLSTNIASPQYFQASLIRPVSRLIRLNIKPSQVWTQWLNWISIL